MTTNTALLGDICKVIAGQSPPSSTYNKHGNGLPFFQGKADFGVHSPKVRTWCNTPIKIAEKGDILISVRAPVGPTNFCDQKSCIGRGLSAIRVSDKMDFNYLRYFLKNLEPRLSGQGRGSTFKAITQQDLKGIAIPLLPLKEQKRIVKELDAADQLRQKRKQAIALLDDYLKSTFLDMFGDPITNPKGWEVRTMEDMIEFMTSGSRGWAKYYANNGDVFLRIQNVKNNNLDMNDICYVNPPNTAEARRTIVCEGDVLLSITADLGRTAVVPKNIGTAYINQHLALLRLKNGYMPDYISEYIASIGGKSQFDKLDKGGVKAGLNFNDIRSLKIPFPDIRLQKEYILKRNQILHLKQSMLAQLDELDTNFNALMQRAFRK